MSYLNLKHINKSLNNTNILNDINFQVNKGEFISILGPSGCGKTTLLRIISGLEDVTSGKIYLNNKNITNLSPGERKFGFVFQNYILFPNMTVEENVIYGFLNKSISKQKIKEKLENILDLIRIKDIRYKYPNELSGGQQQRVSLARAIILSPQVLLLDEPLSALDAKIREELRSEIKRIQLKLGITTIMVTHDQEEALIMSNRVVVMEKYRIAQIGTPEEIYVKPKNKFVADFIGKTNILDALDTKIKIIRPENIRYSIDKKDGFLLCLIKNIEFRGAFYRLALQIKDRFKYSEILLDMLTIEKEKLNLKENTEIYIELSNSVCISNKGI